MIPYLTDFWNLASGASQDIGNAVAGALGNIVLLPIKILVDFGLALAYVISQLYVVLTLILSPIWFIYYWVVNMAIAIGTPQTTNTLFTVEPAVLTFFTAIPLFTTLITALGATLFFLALWQTFKIIRS